MAIVGRARAEMAGTTKEDEAPEQPALNSGVGFDPRRRLRPLFFSCPFSSRLPVTAESSPERLKEHEFKSGLGVDLCGQMTGLRPNILPLPTLRWLGGAQPSFIQDQQSLVYQAFVEAIKVSDNSRPALHLPRRTSPLSPFPTANADHAFSTGILAAFVNAFSVQPHRLLKHQNVGYLDETAPSDSYESIVQPSLLLVLRRRRYPFPDRAAFLPLNCYRRRLNHKSSPQTSNQRCNSGRQGAVEVRVEPQCCPWIRSGVEHLVSTKPLCRDERRHADTTAPAQFECKTWSNVRMRPVISIAEEIDAGPPTKAKGRKGKEIRKGSDKQYEIQ
ncbi:hypothetical protein NMY22_g18164 [Coprinellus aureogranulatus]|nr:hypothetical protein NMY22_g18164 [Coprinellus aureogranulatus]